MPIGSGQMVLSRQFIGGQRYSGLLEGKGTVDYRMAKVQLITGTTIIFCHTVLLTRA